MEQQNAQDKINTEKDQGYEQCPFYRRERDEELEEFADFRSSHHHGHWGPNWWGYPYNPYFYGSYPYVPFYRDEDGMNYPGYRHSHHHNCEPNICLPKIPVPKMKWIKPKFYTPDCCEYPYYANYNFGNMPYPNMMPYENKNVNENLNINRD